MNRTQATILALVIGLILGYSIRWFEVERSSRKSLVEARNYIVGDDSAELFEILNDLGITRDHVKMTFAHSGLQIEVEVPDSSVGHVVEGLKDVAPSHPVSLKVSSERGTVFLLPTGPFDGREILDRLKGIKPSEQAETADP